MASEQLVAGKPYALRVVKGQYEPLMVQAVGKCVFTKIEYKTSPFQLKHFNQWLSGGEPMQLSPLRNLSADDREFLISGTSPKFWEQVKDLEE